MKKLLTYFLLLFFVSIDISAQTQVRADKVIADYGLFNPVNDTLNAPGRVGEQRFRLSDNTTYVCLSMTAGVKRWFPYAFGGTSGTAWSITGNIGTSAGTNFIGTKDVQPLMFRVSDSIAGYIQKRIDGFLYPIGSVALGMGALRKTYASESYCNIAIGPSALYEFVGAGGSQGAMVAVGRGALRDNRTGYRNVAVGEYAMFQAWGGDHNTGVGVFAQEVSAGGSFNAAFGDEAMRGKKQGSYNTGIGAWGLYQTTTVVASITITNGGSGYLTPPTVTFSSPDPASPGTVSAFATGTAVLTGNAVTSVTITSPGSGYSDEKAPVTVSFSGGSGTGAAGTVVLRSPNGLTGVGFAAGWKDYSGYDNTYVGALAGGGNVAYVDSLCSYLGYSAARLTSLSGTTSLYNATAIGSNALVGQSNSIVLGDTIKATKVGIGITSPRKLFDVVGGDVLLNNINAGIGGGAITTNTIFGRQALDSNTTGARNTAIGYQTSLLISNGNSPVRNDNTSVGYQAFNNNYGSRVTSIGSFACANGGGSDATAVGHNALLLSRPSIGLATSGLAAFGKSALQNNSTGINNTGLGDFAGCAITTGTDNVAVGLLSMAAGNSVFGGTPSLTGIRNTAVGTLTGYNITTGGSNTIYGYQSGFNITTGSNNIFIGALSGLNSTTVNNAVIIGGHNGTGVTDNQILVADGAGNERARIDNVGNVSIANGSLSLVTAGNKLNIAIGSNASVGTATLSSGTVTISTTAVTASSLIFVVYNTPSGTIASGLSAPTGSIVASTSFVINSLTTAGVVNTLDNSTVRWWIIN